MMHECRRKWAKKANSSAANAKCQGALNIIVFVLKMGKGVMKNVPVSIAKTLVIDWNLRNLFQNENWLYAIVCVLNAKKNTASAMQLEKSVGRVATAWTV